MEMYYQACYTRVGRQGADSGWRAVFVTPFIPEDALKRFQTIAASVIRRKNMQEEVPPEVFLVCSDEKYTYLCNIVMECAGDDGRGNSFAHAYICKKSDFFHLLQSEPDAILIKGTNFRKKREELSGNISERVICLDHYCATKEEIIDKYDMKETYAHLLYCVLAVMSRREKRLLIICRAREPEKIKTVCKEIMFLILSLIPDIIRTELSFSSCEIGKGKICFICQEPIEGQEYFDLDKKTFYCDISSVKKFTFIEQCLYGTPNSAWEKTKNFMESVFGNMRGEGVSCRLIESVFCYYKGEGSNNTVGVLNDMLAAKPVALPSCYAYLKELLQNSKEEEVDTRNRERLEFLVKNAEDENFMAFYYEWKQSSSRNRISGGIISGLLPKNCFVKKLDFKKGR